MDQGLRRVICLMALVVVTGCSDDSNKENEVTKDAGVDSGSDETPPKKDASTDEKKDSGMSTSPGTSCDDLKCKAPATCSVKDGKAHCSCPSGYDDPKGDGSECKDKDECANDDANDCAKHATCNNTPGGYECKCNAPAYKGDGKSCSCGDGYTEKDGVCLAPDGAACGDSLDCANEHCVGKICCAVACNTPDAECRSTEMATCSDGKTCNYPVAKDGAACDDGNACTSGSTCKEGACQKGTDAVNCNDNNPCTDDSCDMLVGCKNQNNTATCDDGNPCTLNDKCGGGQCGSTTLMNCSSANDACNVGECDPSNGSCKKKPVADGKACNDSSTCTPTDQCMGGMCKGQGNACGPNASACTAGTPNDCTCKADYVESAGLCIPTNNECAQSPSPCSPNATCFDQSNGPNDVTCKCNEGYEGDGKTCTVKEPCKNNPCGEGRGTCTPGTLGTYTCGCSAGYKAVGGTCVCDLSGTFAGRSTAELKWSNMTGVEDGEETSYSWVIQRQEYQADGTVETEIINCGESHSDLCSTVLGNESFSQYAAASYFEGTANAPAMMTFKVPKALPNEPFETAPMATLVGISLTDPMGAWPATRHDVQGSPDYDGSATNGARWIDADNDSLIGLTTYAVGPGGISSEGSGPRPIESYGATSPECPRNNANAARWPYNYPPAADGLQVRRVKRFYSANRTISSYKGKVDSCNQMSGDVVGPNGGIQRVDAVIGGCVRVNGDGEAACSSSLLDFLGGGGQSQDVQSMKFKFIRSAANITCEQVRAMNF